MHTVKYTIKIDDTKRYYAVSFDTQTEAINFAIELELLPGEFVVRPYIVEGI